MNDNIDDNINYNNNNSNNNISKNRTKPNHTVQNKRTQLQKFSWGLYIFAVNIIIIITNNLCHVKS